MAIEWIDGFDFYTAGHTGNAPFNQRYNDVTSGASTSWSVQTGRFAGRCIRSQGAGGVCRINTGLTARTTFTYAFAYRKSSSLTNNERVFGLLSGTTYQNSLRTHANGSITVNLGDTATVVTGATSAAGVITVAVWSHIEVEIVISDTVGEARVWVDGAQVINVSGVDTRNVAGTANADGVQFGGAANTGDQDYDDLWIGTTATEHKGDVRIETLVPTADTADKDWTPNSGTVNYDRVDESQPDADTTYVASATVGHLDKYDLGALSSTPAAVYAVQTTMYARKDDATVREVRTLIDSGGSVSNHPNRAMGATYGPFRSFDTTDPNGGGAWSAAAVDALKVGIEVMV